VIASFVAELDGAVIGHVLFSPLTIESRGAKFKAAALGPVSVLPEHQGKGVGSALVRHGLQACLTLEHRSVFLVGAPEYYGRFGFLAARVYGINYEGGHSDTFQVVELSEGALDGVTGIAKYEPEFDLTSKS
jgi:putative acetyltransferase